nr:heavy metal translocating P-type ATPase [Ruthenibacterium lactatiformans]
MVKQKYNVTGMTCSACSAHVEKAVRGVQGVSEVSVNLLTNSMVVESDAPLEQDVIVKAVEHAGYGASPADGRGAGPAAKPGGAPAQNPMQAQLKNMRMRLWVSFAFLAPLMYVSMGSMAGLPLPGFLTGHENAVGFALTQLLLTLPVVYVNRKYYEVGFKTLLRGSPNMDSLIAIGSTAALVYGVFAIYRIGYGLGVGDHALVSQYHMDLYFESAAMILALITLGKYLETRSKGKTSEAITKLMDLAPKTAAVERGGMETVIPAEEVVVGDTVLVRPGQSVPVDGVILEGNTSIDEAAITGESIPVEKEPGSTVIAATINKAGFFKFRATKVGADTTLAQIIRLVEDASSSKAPIAKLADKISGVFVPVVIGIALAASIGWLLAGQTPEFAVSIGISVLVISCPCALGLATPVAIMVGTGKGAENGILIKSGEALETAHSINAIVLDKTGTITEGKPAVTDILPVGALAENELLALAAGLERQSEHPLAQAVLECAARRGVQPYEVTDFKAVFGKGIEGRYAQELYFAGNEAMLAERGMALPAPVKQKLDALAGEGKTPLLFCGEKTVLGVIAVADTVKPSSAAAIADLKRMGIDVTMLTGDNRRTAEAIRRQLDIPHVIAEVLPQEKEQHVAALQQQGKTVAMVGDGINDAPALARADVGIAIGAGTDVAIESADVVLMKSDLADAVTAIRLSKAVIRNIKENLFWAFFYNTVGIPVAAGLLYLPFHLRLNPMIGAAAMSLSSVCVVMNALRLKRFKAHPAHAAAEQGAPLSPMPAQPRAERIELPQNENINKNDREEKQMKTITLIIEGMMCQNCRSHVDKALNGISGVAANVSLEEKKAVCTVEDGVSADTLKAAVEDAGYTVISVE